MEQAVILRNLLVQLEKQEAVQDPNGVAGEFAVSQPFLYFVEVVHYLEKCRGSLPVEDLVKSWLSLSHHQKPCFNSYVYVFFIFVY